MSIQERIQLDITQAMRTKDSARLDVLRAMKTAIKMKEVEKVKALEESEVLQVLQTLVKQRKDSIEQFTKGGRSDLVAREEDQLTILQSYLPAAISIDEIKAVVTQVIGELGTASPKDLGKVMKAVMSKFVGKVVDGKLVSESVRAQLGG
jgi:uncharacterized protein YqeY